MLWVRNLCKTFNRDSVNEKKVFENFSLDIEDGDFITIIGSNGAGKSTFLNLLSGSIESDEGSMKLDGEEIIHLEEFKRTRFIGRVFQDPSMGTSPGMTIGENLSMAFNKGKKFNLSMGVRKKDIPKYKEILSTLNLGLEDQINSKVGLLSGGQRQSLSLIMATAIKPKLLLLDEHTAALDPKTSERIIELTKEVVNRNNITTLMVTHNLEQAINVGNRLLMFHGGEVVLDIKGEEKRNLTIEGLLKKFEKIQSKNILSDRALFN
ncbi:MAG: ATP-binding cassette domain-containing protein [Anaeromicrobium sp.]|jgi:putative ABC transport system ATP-binding protein|uniref:ABC transporter ATP-binding protein n=1 Tax=Anaeromicrobium sp. TaxID=1929132 RepID=UPI0025E92622|nr:ATP-binding cassette domain-containing protein [Anaeromicrobium sp.]MCT4592651.1 ATP-binding cassette domain-containing protein [Anaeromicrobium sp.]